MSQRVFLAGATGYIGRHVARELVRRGYEVVCFARERSGIGGAQTPDAAQRALAGSEVRFGDVCDPSSLRQRGVRNESFDAVVSCIASRTGGVEDSWRVDFEANRNLLQTAQRAGTKHFVLLSAICVQKPMLAFQHAKLAFERELVRAPMTHSIVRPTAFFKSLAGQVARLQAGKPYLMFGDGSSQVKPISEADLARFVADCLTDPDKHDRVLPVGGPEDAISARERGALLFELMGCRPRFRRIPIGLFDAIVPSLAAMARVVPPLADKAEFARIARYYATESMVLWDAERQKYDARATPSYGQDTLREFYERVLSEGMAGQELGDQALFE
jgi:divinyl chlorophyllide a 8-vinyl-reductase